MCVSCSSSTPEITWYVLAKILQLRADSEDSARGLCQSDRAYLYMLRSCLQRLKVAQFACDRC
jgi:hypothetical protein